MFKSFLLSLAILVGSFGVAVAQTSPDSISNEDAATVEPYTEQAARPKFFTANKLVVGGNMGFQVGNLTSIEVSPVVGYRITESTIVGLGPVYNYWSYRDPIDPDYRETYNIFGGRGFIRQNLMWNIFLHAEYEKVTLAGKAKYDGNVIGEINESIPARLLLGGGYTYNFGRGPGFSLELLYDVLDRSSSLNRSPLVIRGGFLYGF